MELFLQLSIFYFILYKQNTRAKCPLKYSINTNKSTVLIRIVVIYFSCMYFSYKRCTCMKKKSLLFESVRYRNIEILLRILQDRELDSNLNYYKALNGELIPVFDHNKVFGKKFSSLFQCIDLNEAEK